jgi:RNA polymerase sigma factor (sigma-70 family)
MTHVRLSPVLRHLRRLVGPPLQNGVSDAQLLERFVRQNDEAAFELLLWRHGPMAWNLCRRILPDFHEAEDAFQAAMLVLAKKAGSISKKQSLASWLYKVTFRIALRARADSSRRVHLERQARSWRPRFFTWEPDNGFTELRPLIDEALNELPEKYRAPVVLCYLQNKTNEEAARLLQWPIGTVKTRLAKARELLGRWLRHRGVIMSAAGLTSILKPTSNSALTAGILTATLKAAMLVSAGSFGAAAVSIRALLLMEGTMKAMIWTKVKIVTAVVMCVGVAGSGAGVITYRSWAADQPGNAPLVVQKTDEPAQNAPKVPPPPELKAAQAERDKAAADLRAAETTLNQAKFYLEAAQKKVDALKQKTQADQPANPKAPVAFIFDMPITREQLGDYLIAQYGADKLEQLVNKLIIERACREKGITVTDAEIDLALKDDMKSMSCDDLNVFEERIKKFQKPLLEWREDVVKSNLCMTKLARMLVSASEDDIRRAFEGAYGEKIECQIITLSKGQEAAQEAHLILHSGPEDFDRFARKQGNKSLAAREGKIEPFGRHTTGDEIFEDKAFALKPGETSIVETDECTIIVKCIRRIPSESGVKLEDVRAKLTEQVLAKKTQQEIPRLFEELKKQAKPRLLLKK